MDNIKYVRIEGTGDYKISLKVPERSTMATESNGIIEKVKDLGVNERKSIEKNDHKWNCTIDEFSVVYAGSCMIIKYAAIATIRID